MNRREHRADFEAHPAAVRQAREFVTMNVGQLPGLDNSVLELVVSELVTNVVVHARTPFEILVVVDPLCVRVEITDHSRRAPVPKAVDEKAEGGRGLLIVGAVARGWGYEFTAEGKVVWVEVDTVRPG